MGAGVAMRARVLNSLVSAIIAIAAINSKAGFASASTLASAKIEPHGATQEIHFRFDGPAPRFKLTAHGTGLQIDLG
ncbi:MAG TPA: hypothetical protein VMT58_06485, partial [Candidatus Binataceae bacterium]|nr:hypothetical protein [Candidatus Binataceae bacterium]